MGFVNQHQSTDKHKQKEVCMKKYFLIGMLSLAVMSCDRRDQMTDNTGMNRDGKGKTAFDQSDNEKDRALAQRVRQAIMSEEGLSNHARNIVIITENGVVILRGPVLTPREKEIILRKVRAISGVSRVDDQLEVNQNQ